MTLPDVADLTHAGGLYPDPEKITDLVRFLQNANSGGVAKSMIVKTSPGLLFGFTVSSVSAQFIQLFDAATLPADATVPTLSFPVDALKSLPVAYVSPRGFRNGIVICNSSTQHTKTLGATADCIFDVQYI